MLNVLCLVSCVSVGCGSLTEFQKKSNRQNYERRRETKFAGNCSL